MARWIPPPFRCDPIRPRAFPARCGNDQRNASAGCSADTLWVSLDGLKETHDDLRSNSFDRIRLNLQKTKHPRVFIHCTFNRRNWREVEPLATWVRDLPTVRGMTVQFFYPYNQGEDDLALLPEERHAVIRKLLELKKKGFPILNSAGRLRAMLNNDWRCHDDLLINVDPDGTITQGCYVKTAARFIVRPAALHRLPKHPAHWI